MPILRKSPQDVLAKAKADLAKWEGKLQEAEEELGRLELADEHLNDVPDDELEAAIVQRGDQLNDAKLKVEVAWTHITRTRELIKEAQRRVIEQEADREGDAAKEAEKALSDHRRITQELRAKLREHDGVDYLPRVVKSTTSRAEFTTTSVTSRMERAVRTARTREAVLRYWLKTGHKPMWVSRRSAGQVTHDPGYGNMMYVQIKADAKPDCLYGPEADLPPEPAKPEIKPETLRFNSPTW